MNLVFRQVEPHDHEGFSVLMDQLSKRADSRELLVSKINRAISNPDMYLMCAELDGELVGSLIGLLCEDFCGDCRPILFIENVVTLEKCRGLGIGRKMFEAIEGWGRAHDCSYAVLVSGMDREGAHKFYDAIGYAEVKGYKKYL